MGKKSKNTRKNIHNIHQQTGKIAFDLFLHYSFDWFLGHIIAMKESFKNQLSVADVVREFAKYFYRHSTNDANRLCTEVSKEVESLDTTEYKQKLTEGMKSSFKNFTGENFPGEGSFNFAICVATEAMCIAKLSATFLDVIVCTLLSCSRLTGPSEEELISFLVHISDPSSDASKERQRCLSKELRRVVRLYSDRDNVNIDQKGLAMIPKLLIQTLPKMVPTAEVEGIIAIFKYRIMALLPHSLPGDATELLLMTTIKLCRSPIRHGFHERKLRQLSSSSSTTTDESQQYSPVNGTRIDQDKGLSLRSRLINFFTKGMSNYITTIDDTNAIKLAKWRTIGNALPFEIEYCHEPPCTSIDGASILHHSEEFCRVQSQLLDICENATGKPTQTGSSSIDLRTAFQRYVVNLLYGICFNTVSKYQERHSMLMDIGIKDDNIPRIEMRCKDVDVYDEKGEESKVEGYCYISKRDVDFLRLGDGLFTGLQRSLSHRALAYYYLFNKSNPDKSMHHFKLSLESFRDWKSATLQSEDDSAYLTYLEDAYAYLNAYGTPGGQCDGCCTKRKQGMSSMKVCGRCQRTYYCSRNCQKKHWRTSHKECCRRKGEFKKGDHVMLTKTILEFLPSCFEVVLQEQNDDGSWLVSGVAVEREAIVTRRQIRVITPLDRRFLAASFQKRQLPVATGCTLRQG